MDGDNKNRRPEYDLESILAEFGGSPPKKQEAPPPEPQEMPPSGQSGRLVLKSMDDAFSADGMDVVSGQIGDLPPAPEPKPEPKPEPEPWPEPKPQPVPTPEPAPEDTRPEIVLREVADSAAGAEYASARSADNPPPEFDREEPAAEDERGREPGRTQPRKERAPSPLMALLALAAMQRERRANPKSARAIPTRPAPAPQDAAEVPPDQAGKFYSLRMRSLRLRGQIAALLCVFMLYLTFAWYSTALPLLGALNGNIRVMSLLLLIYECSVVMAGLDVFTAGILNLFRRRMGTVSLISVSCLLSLVDAAVTAASGAGDYGLPFCAVSAISLTFALWGEYYAAKGLRLGFRVLTSSKSLYTVTGERGLAPNDVALLKSRQSVRGFVSRSMEPDCGEEIYAMLTPFLLAAALVFGLLSAVVPGRGGAIVHCISVLSAAAATFSCAVCYALPFAAAARRLEMSGGAVAGWAGLRDIGGAKRVVITDEDIFPRGTVEISRVRVLEGAFSDRVISATASVIAASGCGLAGPFADLLRRNGYTVGKVENFVPHDGGGMTAMVEGENVYVGSAGFMNLMGIRLPQKLATHGSVYTAINGALVGIFQVEYKPTKSVQDALMLLLRSKMEPIFAIRDFNITPAMIKDVFRMPTDDFKFPPYAERYRISGATPDRASRVAAVIVRDGMAPLVDVAEKGRKAQFSIRAAALISAAGSVFGVILMLLLCWTGSFDSASASNVVIFMLLWLIPLIVSIIGLER